MMYSKSGFTTNSKSIVKILSGSECFEFTHEERQSNTDAHDLARGVEVLFS
jgi:hypothetical protein